MWVAQRFATLRIGTTPKVGHYSRHRRGFQSARQTHNISRPRFLVAAHFARRSKGCNLLGEFSRLLLCLPDCCFLLSWGELFALWSWNTQTLCSVSRNTSTCTEKANEYCLCKFVRIEGVRCFVWLLWTCPWNLQLFNLYTFPKMPTKHGILSEILLSSERLCRLVSFCLGMCLVQKTCDARVTNERVVKLTILRRSCGSWCDSRGLGWRSVLSRSVRSAADIYLAVQFQEYCWPFSISVLWSASSSFRQDFKLVSTRETAQKNFWLFYAKRWKSDWVTMQFVTGINSVKLTKPRRYSPRAAMYKSCRTCLGMKGFFPRGHLRCGLLWRDVNENNTKIQTQPRGPLKISNLVMSVVRQNVRNHSLSGFYRREKVDSVFWHKKWIGSWS